jgi:hypothetical protein
VGHDGVGFRSCREGAGALEDDQDTRCDMTREGANAPREYPALSTFRGSSDRRLPFLVFLSFLVVVPVPALLTSTGFIFPLIGQTGSREDKKK